MQSRCKREGIECKFLPSRRAGRIPYQVQLQRQQEAAAAAASTTTAISGMVPSNAGPQQGSSSSHQQRQHDQRGQPYSLPTSTSGGPAYSFPAPLPLPYQAQQPGQHGFYFPPTYGHYSQPYGHTSASSPSHFPVPAAAPPIFPSSQAPALKNVVAQESPPINSPDAPSDTKTASSASSLTNARKKRRKESHAPVGAEALAAASLRNPVDALDLLVMAADGVPRLASDDDERNESTHGTGPTNPDATPASNHKQGRGDADDESDHSAESKEQPPPTLEDFPLVKNGVLTGAELVSFVELFFSRIHPSFPIIPASRLPKTEAEIAKFAAEELYLTAVFVVIASRFKNLKIHQQSWAYFQTLISQVMLGQHASVGAVEALLILSEYPPRKADNSVAQINSEENREAWMLVGAAVRLGYMLGLDQKTFLPPTAIPEDNEMSAADEVVNRERLAWTYCYIFDRQISIRTGKAFWSRGPALCFSGGAIGGHTATAIRNFPTLRPGSNQEDYASLVQAYVELTQIMTSVHDILYPNRQRTQSLIKRGEYWKYLDELSRSLESFKVTWIDERWPTFPLNELCWVTFHYLRLYIAGFAFQAHVQRAAEDIARLGPERQGGDAIFPGGVTASPDARYIVDAVDAACDLLRLVTDRLHPGGALPFLPQRFFMTFSYAGVFLLKAIFVEAVPAADRRDIVRLVKRVIFVLVCASTDEQHCGQRYARLLNGLLRAFSKGQESFYATQAPSRTTSPGPADRRAAEPNNAVSMSSLFDGAAFGSPAAPDSKLNAPLYPPVFSALPTTTTDPASAAPTPSAAFTATTPAQSGAQDTLNGSGQNIDFSLSGNWDDPAVMPSVPGVDAINFLLDDSALDFWQSFSSNAMTPAVPHGPPA